MSGSRGGWAEYSASVPPGSGACLSIDVGTSNTVAVLSAYGRPPHVVDVDGASTMPSAVFAAEDGRLVVGREAERLARLSPARFEPNPKRRVDDGTLLLGDAVVPVTAALAAVLGKVLAEATRQLGGAWPDEVRLTHPAQWGAARCAVLLAAARQAGLPGRVQLVPEPVAAVAHFAAVTGWALAPGQAMAVYDLGAGTFDVAVVAAGPQGFTVLAEAGLPDLGGLDVDQALLEHLGRQVADRDPDGWQRLLNPRSTEERRAARTLREDIRIAKEALSEHPQTEVALPEPFGVVLVTRAELEGLIEPGLRRSVELLAATARDAGADVGRLAAVYLVGGSSRIPLVARLIAEQLGVVPTALHQPETSVAFGAHQVAGASLDARTHEVPPQQTAVTFPYPPQPHPVRRKGRGALVGVLSALVVIAVVAVIVLAPWRDGPTSSSSQTGGPNGKGGFHWSLTKGETGYLTGLWATPNGVVLGTDAGLTAYDVRTGATLWSWRVPADTFLCNMSPSTANGIGAVTYGPWSDEVGGAEVCDRLQTISLGSGEPGWDEPVDLTVEGYSGWLGKIGGTALSISDELVTAAYAGRNAQSEHSTDLLWVDVRTGKRVGSTDSGPEPLRIGCRLTGFAQALRDQVIAAAVCPGYSSPGLLRWREDWLAEEDLEGCGEISNVLTSGFMYGEGDNVVVGCGGAGLDRLYVVTYNGYSTAPADLSGVAVDAVDVGDTSRPPRNVLVSGESMYLVKGADGNSDGVVATKMGYAQSWQYALGGASQVRLMAATGTGVTVLVTTPGPASLHTVTGPNRATAGPDLPPDVADLLPNATQAVRVGDFLVCGFDGIENDETVIGVVRAAP
jgi:hypothetical protein